MLGVGRRVGEDASSSTCTVERNHVRDSDRSPGATWTSTPRTKPRARVRHLVPRRRPSFRRLLFHPSRRPLFLSHPPFRLMFASSRRRPTRGRIRSVRTDASVRRTAPRSVCTIRHRSWPWTCGSRAIFVSVPGPTWKDNPPIQPPKTAIPTIPASPMLTTKTTVHAVQGGPGRSLRPDAPSHVPYTSSSGHGFPPPIPPSFLPHLSLARTPPRGGPLPLRHASIFVRIFPRSFLLFLSISPSLAALRTRSRVQLGLGRSETFVEPPVRVVVVVEGAHTCAFHVAVGAVRKEEEAKGSEGRGEERRRRMEEAKRSGERRGTRPSDVVHGRGDGVGEVGIVAWTWKRSELGGREGWDGDEID